VIDAFRAYISTPGKSGPSSEVYLDNLTLKMSDKEFVGDIDALIRPGIEYDPRKAFEIVRKQLIDRI
jgi:hypothetical protein